MKIINKIGEYRNSLKPSLKVGISTAIFLLSLSFCIWVLPSSWRLFSWVVANILSNLVLFYFFLNTTRASQNVLEEHLKRRRMFWHKRKTRFASYLDRRGRTLFQWGSDLLNYPLNLVRVFQKFSSLRNRAKSPYALNSWIDSLVLLSFVLSATIFIISDASKEWLWTELFASYFVWRIISLFFLKLHDIFERLIASFNRTVILSLFNVVDLVICYAYLYLYLGIIQPPMKLDAFLFSFRVFTTQGVDNGMRIACFSQKLLLISQLIVFIVLFMMVIANIFNLKEEGRKRRREYESHKSGV
jgi:hypothetical protein